jgi:hypothetical protein
MEGLLAASLYETLEPDDSMALQRHLADCATCRAEYASLQAFVGQLAPAQVEFQGDLLPAIREELRQTGRQPWFSRWTRAIAGLCVLIFVFGVFVVADGPGETKPENVARVQPTDASLAEARRLVAADDASGALKVLKAALDTAPHASIAGALQLEVAEIEYIHFRRYEAAYDTYKSVREVHPEAWTQSPGIVKERFDLLTEARDANFEPLYQIDKALKQGENGMPELEQVMARYPGRGVAQAAMETMMAMVDGEGLSRVEAVRSQCTNPVALAQLDVRIGEGYCTGNLDPAKGKALLHAVADSPYAVPAQMAKDVLARLESGEK